MSSVRSVVWRAAFASALLVFGAARAQQATPVPVTSDAYQPLGLRAGGFYMFPSVESGIEVTDNAFATETDRREDAGAYVAPRLRIESEWTRHQMQLQMSSRHLFYFRHPSEDTNEANLRASGRIDVLSTTAVELEAAYALDQEGRGSVDVPGAAARPPDTHRIESSAAVTHRIGRVDTRIGANFSNNIYEDAELIGGGTSNNSDRNYYGVGGELRIGYDVSPRVQPFVEGRYSVRRHEQEVDDSGLRRDSEGYNVAAGVRLELGPKLTGEASVGYVRRDFEDDAIAPAEGLTVNADLTWRPSALTTIKLDASTEVEETSTGTSGGAVVYRVGAEVDHALRRHFLFGLGASYTFRDFSGSALTEETFYLAAGFTYQFNREWAVRAGYSFTSFDSSTPGSDYYVNALTLGLLWQR